MELPVDSLSIGRGSVLYISLIKEPYSFQTHESNQLLVRYNPLSKNRVFFLSNTSHPVPRTEDFLPP